MDLLEQSHVPEPLGQPVVALEKRIEVFGGCDVPAVLVLHVGIDRAELLAVENQKLGRVEEYPSGEVSVRKEVHPLDQEYRSPVGLDELDSEFDVGPGKPYDLDHPTGREPVDTCIFVNLGEGFPALRGAEADKELVNPSHGGFSGRFRHTSSLFVCASPVNVQAHSIYLDSLRSNLVAGELFGADFIGGNAEFSQ